MRSPPVGELKLRTGSESSTGGNGQPRSTPHNVKPCLDSQTSPQADGKESLTRSRQGRGARSSISLGSLAHSMRSAQFNSGVYSLNRALQSEPRISSGSMGSKVETSVAGDSNK